MLGKLNRFARHIGNKPYIVSLRKVFSALAQQIGRARISMGKTPQPREPASTFS